MKKHIANLEEKIISDGIVRNKLNLEMNGEDVFLFGISRVPKEIKKLTKKITEQGKVAGIDFRYIENKKKHQKKPTECGVYSLFMIINILKGTKKPEDFLTDDFPDEEMQTFRNTYFNRDL